MNEILKLLEKDARYNAAQLAAMTGSDEAAVAAYIAAREADNTILGYTALVDWDKTDNDMVTALIEVKIAPQRGDGFDRIAERIYQYDEVESLYLASGAFDLAVIITGRSLRDISQFVYAHLAPIEGVTATATHFIMKKYKEKRKVFDSIDEQEERILFV